MVTRCVVSDAPASSWGLDNGVPDASLDPHGIPFLRAGIVLHENWKRAPSGMVAALRIEPVDTTQAVCVIGDGLRDYDDL